MRVLLDPDDGELLEVLPSDVSGTEPYNFADAKRAVMAATREKRDVLKALEEAIIEKAEADEAHAIALSGAIESAKEEHGSTVAEKIAKGNAGVASAAARATKAADRVKGLHARLDLCSEDRASLHRLIEWSREADPDGWR